MKSLACLISWEEMCRQHRTLKEVDETERLTRRVLGQELTEAERIRWADLHRRGKQNNPDELTPLPAV